VSKTVLHVTAENSSTILTLILQAAFAAYYNAVSWSLKEEQAVAIYVNLNKLPLKDISGTAQTRQ